MNGLDTPSIIAVFTTAFSALSAWYGMKTRAEIMALMRELNAAGATVLMVTHDEQVAKNARRILRMRDGRFE